MKVTAEQLKRMAKGSPPSANVQSVLISIRDYGTQIGIDLPHRLAHFLAQELHESGSFRYDKEIASGKEYEGRKDLGNTKKGDGVKFKGRGPEQMTGRSNYHRFTIWVRKFIPDAPDFEEQPDLVNTDPYEGLTAIWFWSVGNSTGKSLNVYADANNIEMITRKINGGLNGYADRLEYYDRASFVLLGYKQGDYSGFQAWAKRKGWYDGKADGDPGPKTRAAMHQALVHLTDVGTRPETSASPVVETKEVPVETKVEVPVETPVPVAVGPSSLDKPFYKDPDFIERVGTGAVGTSVIGFVTNADVIKIAVIGAIFIIGGVIWYALRTRKAAHQEVKMAAVNAQAAEIRSKM